uniref:Uncharacterized protein n=1 Tax=Pithovirus LCPAC406 TaxID=2506599 RepID=A0A481ZDD6_9VIRU|nr:MAG: hypothetical protein LCPAC406_01110 [Pithovirus LCPAC406]
MLRLEALKNKIHEIINFIKDGIYTQWFTEIKMYFDDEIEIKIDKNRCTGTTKKIHVAGNYLDLIQNDVISTEIIKRLYENI